MSEDAPRLDVREYVQAFGGRQQVISRMYKRFKINLSIKQVDKWVERNSIPGMHLINMQVIASEYKPPIDIFDFVK